jgi:hypothetical protein
MVANVFVNGHEVFSIVNLGLGTIGTFQSF